MSAGIMSPAARLITSPGTRSASGTSRGVPSRMGILRSSWCALVICRRAGERERIRRIRSNARFVEGARLVGSGKSGWYLEVPYSFPTGMRLADNRLARGFAQRVDIPLEVGTAHGDAGAFEFALDWS